MVKELARTIKINNSDEEYNVNAVTAETAGKVDNSFTISKTNLDGSIAASKLASFDGSTSCDVTVVPASGGRFTGRVNIDSYTNSTMDPYALLNSGDIKKYIVDELQSNSVLYSWDGTILLGGGHGASIQSVSIITGADEHKDELARYIYENKNVAAYIYISTDDENAGRIYFGTADSENVACVSVSAENALSAVDAENAKKVVKEGDNSVYFDYTKLLSDSELLNNLKIIIFDRLLLNDSNERVARLDKLLATTTDTTESGILQKVTVENAAHAAEADSSTTSALADVATKANCDISGRDIQKNYYRFSGTTSTTDKVITIASSANSADYLKATYGNDGDIVILYS